MAFREIKDSQDEKPNKRQESQKKFDGRVGVQPLSAEKTKTEGKPFDRRVEPEAQIKKPEKTSDNRNFQNRIDVSGRLSDKTELYGKKDEVNSRIFHEYLADVKKFSAYELSSESQKKLEEYIKTNEIKKQPPAETIKKRVEFDRKKKKLIEQWEIENGKKWPRYEKDEVDEKGNVIRKAGDLYDAHHIIELSYGGPNESWNITPMKYSDHQKLHKMDSAKQLFS